MIGRHEKLPGVALAITKVEGGSGANGQFAPGDLPRVTFTITDRAGTRIPLDVFSEVSVLLSGPTTNYQRVVPQISGVEASSVWNADGSYTYTFPSGIPTTYAAPLNDTPSFGREDGELTGDSLAAGTYTVGMEARRLFSVEEVLVTDAGDAVFDILVGNAVAIDDRRVVDNQSCTGCHERVEAHGGTRHDVRYCVTCHTAGAEDGNNILVANGTPGVTIEMDVMIHRLHGAAHLPSVLGIGTRADGTRDYGVAPRPYEMLGEGDVHVDFSHVSTPLMPGAYVAFTTDATNSNYLGTGGNGPMPRDVGYAALPGAHKRLDDKQRSGSMSCTKCHGDPDGSGPLTAPSDGALYKTTATRKACASCHDDVDWTKPYASNGMTMPPQTTDSACATCHPASGTLLAIEDAHLHPFENPAYNGGIHVAITGIAGGTGTDGRHRAGDPIVAQFSVKDDANADLAINSLTRFQMMLSGPSTNPQLILPNINLFDFAFRKSSPFTGNGTLAVSSMAPTARQVIAVIFTSATSFDVVGSAGSPLTNQTFGTITYAGVTFTVTNGTTAFAAGDRFYFEAIPKAASYAIEIPSDIPMEYLGRATGGADVVTVANAPLYWGRQVVWERTALQVATPLSRASNALAPYIELDSAVAAGIVANDRIVIDDGLGNQEYLTVTMVQTVDDKTGADLGARDRFWVSPATRYVHGAGAQVQEVTLSARREGVAYSVTDAASGTITLAAGSFAPGNPIVVSYRTHGRFGFFRGPNDSRQTVFPPAGADSDDIGVTEGDWKGLPLLDGTYKVGAWANRDFSVQPLGGLAPTRAWNDITTDVTTYRGISPPATGNLLFGAATQVTTRDIVDPASCNRCHGDLQAHGFGRRGYETCENCHNIPGFEDGQKARFASWYTGFTPGVSMDFRSLLHKVHMGKDLAQGSAYEVIGVFLGVPYPVQYDEVSFPAKGGASNCTSCHNPASPAWKVPQPRVHPAAPTTPTKSWTKACGSCHDSPSATAHIETQSNFVEACQTCHGPSDTLSVEKVHTVR